MNIKNNIDSVLKIFLPVAAIFIGFWFVGFNALFQASIFDGTIDNATGDPVGLCLGYPDDKRCSGVDCDLPEYDTNPLCMSEAEAGTKLGKSSLGSTGVTHTETVSDLIIKYINFALPYLALAAFAAFVAAGFFYVTAYGNEEQLQKAKKIMIWAVVGLILVIASYTIVQFFASDLVDQLQPIEE